MSFSGSDSGFEPFEKFPERDSVVGAQVGKRRDRDVPASGFDPADVDVGVGEDLTMTGGGSRDPGVVDAVSKELGIPVRVALHPQAVGALGAALIAYDKMKK